MNAPRPDRLQLGACLAASTYWLFGAAMTAAVPTISDDLGISLAQGAIALGATALFAGLFVVAAGRLADRTGRVDAVQVGLACSIAGSLLGATANGQAMLLTGRVLQGLGGALVVPATLALLNARTRGTAQRQAFGRWSLVAWCGVGASIALGGALTASIGWRWIFWLGIPVAVAAMILLKDVAESRARTVQQGSDVPGLLLLAVGLAGLFVTTCSGSSWGWTSPATNAGFALAAVALTTFFIYERRQAKPLLRYALFHRRAFDGALIQAFFASFAGAAAIWIFTLYSQRDRDLSPFTSGLLTLTVAVGVLGAMRIGRRFGVRLPLIAGCGIVAVGLVLVASTSLRGNGYFAVASAGFLLIGVGLGATATPSIDTAVGAATTDQAGTAAGIYRMASSLGASFGIAVPTAVYSSFLAADPTYGGRAAVWAIATACGAMVLGVVAVVRWVPGGPMARPAGKRRHLHIGHVHGRVGAAV